MIVNITQLYLLRIQQPSKIDTATNIRTRNNRTMVTPTAMPTSVEHDALEIGCPSASDVGHKFEEHTNRAHILTYP